MHYFQYQAGELYCEEVPLARIAQEVGTPVYVYSERTLERHVRVFDEALQSVPHLICYAVKANSNINILRRFVAWGTGFDIVSGGELFRVLRAGGSAEKVIFAGVGKTSDEIRYALDTNILFFNVESSAELELIHSIARDGGKKARISIRANPDVDPRTHPYISTGMQKHKFGVSLPEARALYRNTRGLSNVEVVGVQCHLGSQITEIGPFEEALASLRQFILELKSDDVALKYLDFGGGLGISYSTEEPPSPAVYGETVARATKDLGLTIVLEPGRVIAGNAEATKISAEGGGLKVTARAVAMAGGNGEISVELTFDEAGQPEPHQQNADSSDGVRPQDGRYCINACMIGSSCRPCLVGSSACSHTRASRWPRAPWRFTSSG